MATKRPDLTVFDEVVWVKMKSKDRLTPGDMWASHDPNHAHGFDHSLHLKAVGPDSWGKKPGHNIVNGWHWRPLYVRKTSY